MAQFIFSGDPRAPGTDPLKCEIYGLVFTFLQPQDVADETVADKLRNHSHFTEVGASVPSYDLKAVHRGRGSYSVMRNGIEISEGMNKAEAEAFNALSDADKAEYVSK